VDGIVGIIGIKGILIEVLKFWVEGTGIIIGI
jgi:hypothetical protein